MKTTHFLLFTSSLLLVSGTPVSDVSNTAAIADSALRVASASALVQKTKSSHSTEPASQSTATISRAAAGAGSLSSSTPPAPTSGSSSSTPKILALDEKSGAIVTYDGNGRQSNVSATPGPENSIVSSALATGNTSTVNTCRPATNDELSKIPGWSKFVAAATSWGNNQAPESYYLNTTHQPFDK
ncbi:hypothetical protein DFH06DRAFT_1333894 [Mycena polygramma]|nr:hypothetical protein DFH06DRAFT_1333894 [Mycena polygramma]